MFKIFAVSLVALTFSAFARETVCYKAILKVPSEVPSVLCLESVYESGHAGTINVDSYNQSVPFILDVTDFRRHNEDRYKFTAEHTYVEFQDQATYCASARGVKLVVSGESTAAVINPKALTISVEVEENKDPCNLATYETKIPYVLVK